MTASMYGAADRVAKAGDTMTGTLVLTGSPPAQVPAGAATGSVLTSDASGNLTLQAPGAVSGTDYLNVKAYGAKGDGTTNDTTAIQSALTAAATKGGTVYFPAGTYVLSSALAPANQVSLLGAGPGATVLKQTSTTAHGIAYNPTTLTYVSVQNLTVQGPGSGTGVGLYVQANSGANPVTSCQFNNVAITAFGSHGIQLVAATGCSLASVNVSSVGGHAFYLSGGTGNTLDACSAAGSTSTQQGFNLSSVSYATLTGCKASACGGGYLITSGSANALNSCGAESIVSQASQDGTSFKVSGGSVHALTACYSNVNKASAFWVTGSATGVSLVGVQEASPGAGATSSIKVDSGSTATVIDSATVTATSFASSTTNSVTAATVTLPGAVTAGSATVSGSLSAGSGSVSGNLSVTGNLTVSGIGQRVAAYKGSNQSVTSSTTLVNDSALVVALAANATYRIDGYISYTGDNSPAGDLQCTLTVPSGATGSWSSFGVPTGALTAYDAVAIGFATTRRLGTNGAATPMALRPGGVVVTSATSGNLQFQFAQGASSTTSTTVRSGSVLIATRIA
ncbi:glycosyl hydrolase family 28-related protein [Kitasatospora sp. NPDC048545]|uniref:right-handed parallel beta-helix repeat-containing protein n=1 Tax=Kitasatospora sp. NPDC048545 TaxID=3157208 RepID=UPI00340298FA